MCARGSRSSSDNNPAEARSKFFSFSLRQISVNLRKRDKRRIRVVRDRERGEDDEFAVLGSIERG